MACFNTLFDMRKIRPAQPSTVRINYVNRGMNVCRLAMFEFMIMQNVISITEKLDTFKIHSALNSALSDVTVI